jgi:hypothetical protein
MSIKFLEILNEGKESCKYQVRNIGGDVYYKKCKGDKNVYYKKCKGDKKWMFTDEIDFVKNSNSKNTVEFVEKKPKKQPYVRQLEVPQKKGDKLEYLKVYYTNVSPNDFDVSIKDGSIIINPQ